MIINREETIIPARSIIKPFLDYNVSTSETHIVSMEKKIFIEEEEVERVMEEQKISNNEV